MFFKEDGIIQTRAKHVLSKTIALLQELETEGLFIAIEKGKFGDVKRPQDGGKGLAGVCLKGQHYINPFIAIMNPNA